MLPMLLNLCFLVVVRTEPASPVELTTSRIETPQVRWSCASSLEIFAQSFLDRVQPKTRGPERGSLNVNAHVYSVWAKSQVSREGEQGLEYFFG